MSSAGHKTFDESDLVDSVDATVATDAFTPSVKPVYNSSSSDDDDDDDDDDAPVEAASTKITAKDQNRLNREHEERQKHNKRKVKNQRQSLKKQLKETQPEPSTSQQSDSDSDSDNDDNQLPDRLPIDIFEQAAQYVPRSMSKSTQQSQPQHKKQKKSRKEQIIGNKLIKVSQSSVSTNRADGLLGDGTGNYVNKFNKNILNRKRKNVRKPAHITHAQFISGHKPAANFASKHN
ncbi:hypothetical protein E3P81_01665 [Wallemia ichthyophaga]|nr:hypothetical protein E3P97_01666 [Wallemia ichthyophaga]TIB33433.1 hypothetical protein E3P85_01318 [Wallemia ichthyophaga]TIB47455.1 hypothetical protein E3P82_01664 [Wallemia ichthyophaga]TIB51818.1 hypothetical protein E3P81_01665 [Wallemia ichthyophaga]TIB54547.1 hypothetical protein E3P80_01665 [Wallemia ichthyophaga]